LIFGLKEACERIDGEAGSLMKVGLMGQRIAASKSFVDFGLGIQDAVTSGDGA
jgi:hypothetical protein